jgi:Toxin SymE, type I toxin-antitoxin system
MKSQRKIKMSRHYKYRPENPYSPSSINPKLVLSGDWLKQAGFNAGQSVTVEILDKMLVITVK